MTICKNRVDNSVTPKKFNFKVPTDDPAPTESFVAPAHGDSKPVAVSAITTPACPLLTAMWRSLNRINQIGTLNRQTGKFKNLHVNGITAAVTRALGLSGESYDVYFACAVYLTPNSRFADNAYGAWAFWVDIDCGEDKAASGKGYATIEDARQALTKFCADAGLPEPTHIVDSGGGIHVYWVQDSFVSREQWQAYATKLKALTHALNFLADDSRTADIASVLRVPGTLNYKYDPPRPVELVQATDQYIEQASMLQAIDLAHGRLCPVIQKVAPLSTINVGSNQSSHDGMSSTGGHVFTNAEISALLEQLDPDMEYGEWTKVGMAVHHETEGSEDGLAIYDAWSSRGSKYKGAGEVRIKWRSLKSDRENCYNIGTIINMVKAKSADWRAVCSEAADPFEICETTVISGHQSTVRQLPVLQPTVGERAETVVPSSAPVENTVVVDADKQVVPVNPFDQYSLRGMSDEMEKNVVAANPLLDEIALMGQVTVYFAKGNVGKTVISFKLLLDAIKTGRVDPNMVYYLNMDDTATGLVEKNRIAEEYGFNMLAEGHLDFSAAIFKSKVRELIENDQAKGVVLILDTLKKFVNLMDKNQTSAFTNVIRPFVSKGGTVIALAHTNKNPDKNGNPVYGGVSDIMNDIDCAYTIAEVSAENGVKVVEFINVKRRGNVVYNASYSYCYGNNVSYHELLSSVKPVDDMELGAVKLVEAIKSDTEVIEAVKACITDGVNTKMKLADAVAERANISKCSAQQIIEKYIGNDPELHRWNFKRGERGVHVFFVLPATPSASVSEAGLT